jgi:uncharacterized OsmC-like protein
MAVGVPGYHVEARILGNGVAEAKAQQSRIKFDSSPDRSEILPGPAELLCTAFAACVLKNVERFADMMPFQYTAAHIAVDAEREASPPRFARIHYVLSIETDESERRVDLFHRNISKYGTVYNTLASACEVTGDIVVQST